MKKWLIGIIIILSLVCCGLAMAETGGTDGNITWSLSDDGVLTISGTGAMKDYNGTYKNGDYISDAPWGITARSVIIENGVTTIGRYAFAGNSDMTCITIPNGVTNIGNYAFYNCSNIGRVTIPDGVISIGNSAFSGCGSLESITIPNGVTNINNYTFNNCSNLANAIIPDSVTSIGNAAFSGCSSLTSIMIPDGVMSIGDSAFSRCSSMTSITIPDSVTSIGTFAFSGCNNLINIHIDSIGSWLKINYADSYGHPNYVASNCHLFIGDEELTNITIPESVTSICNYAFHNCSNLTSITITGNVASIGNYAFYNCSNLTSIMLPESVTSIGTSAFYNCGKLMNVYIDSIGSWLTINFADEYSHPNYVVSNCHLFIGSDELKSITIPDNVTSIGDYAFEDCSSLTGITIPSSVKSIGKRAFAYCSNLTSVSIPDSVTSIDENAFNNCKKLTNIHIDSIESWLMINFANYSSHPNEFVTNCHLFIGNEELTTITIPGSVTNIGERAFANFTSFENIIIQEGVTSIGTYAFSSCRSLTSIKIPNSITNIGSYAIHGCSKLEKISFLQTRNTVVAFPADGLGYVASGKEPTVYCYQGSSAHTFANKNRWPVVLLDIDDLNGVRTLTLEDDFRIISGSSKKIEAVVFPDQPALNWSSSDPDVVSVANGIITAGNPGTATVTATAGTTSDTINITVYRIAESFSIGISEEWPETDGMVQMTIENLQPADAEIHIIWSSADTTVANVDDTGLVITNKPGDVIISAEDMETKIRQDFSLRVYEPLVTAIRFEPVSFALTGENTQLTAVVETRSQTRINDLVTFTSSDPETATVDEKTGIVTALSHGEAIITATSENGISGEVTLQTHIPASWTQQKPNCTETGITAGLYCSVCNDILIPQESIPATGHDWGTPTYVWSADNSSITAIRVCKNNSEHVETETVSTISEIIKAATCTTKGKTKYTSASFGNPAFTVQTKTLTDIPALGHDWGQPVYEWDDDNSSATASRVCQRDTSHTETEEVLTIPVISRAATCENAGDTTYTAVFTNTGFTTQTKTVGNIPALGHNWGSPDYVWNADYSEVTATRSCINNPEHIETETVDASSQVAKEATCEENGERTYTADFTSSAFVTQKKTVGNIPALGHNWGQPVYDWSNDNSTVTASRVCGRDASHTETEEAQAVPVISRTATCNNPGETTYTAVFSNPSFTTQTKTSDNIPATGHNWNDPTYTWNSDNSRVTASHVCTRDNSHIETEEVGIAYQSVIPPTNAYDGSYVYITEAFENPAFTAQRKEGVIPSLLMQNAVYLPSSLTVIEEEAFANTGFEAIIVPETCREIKDYAFSGCTQLQYVRIPEGTVVSPNAFDGCQNVVVDICDYSALPTPTPTPPPTPTPLQKKTISLFGLATIEVPATMYLSDSMYYDSASSLGMSYRTLNYSDYTSLKNAMQQAYGSVDEFTLNGIRMLGIAQVDPAKTITGVAFITNGRAIMVVFIFDDDQGGQISAECLNSIRLTSSGETPTPPPELPAGSIHVLYGKTIAEANTMLEDKLLHLGDGYYSNGYFGVTLDSNSRIDWMAILDGDKYTLFAVKQGMGWIMAQATLVGFGNWGWKPINDSPNDSIFICTMYPDRQVAFTKDTNGKVKNIIYGHGLTGQ